jgi:hypothetical protein
MKPTRGQINDIAKYFGCCDSEILFEGGSDCMRNGEAFFYGDFIVKIKRKGVYRFTDGVLINKIK